MPAYGYAKFHLSDCYGRKVDAAMREANGWELPHVPVTKPCQIISLSQVGDATMHTYFACLLLLLPLHNRHLAAVTCTVKH